MENQFNKLKNSQTMECYAAIEKMELLPELI